MFTVSGTISRIFSDQVLAYLRSQYGDKNQKDLPCPGESVQYLDDEYYLYISDFYQFLNQAELYTNNPEFAWEVYDDFDFRNMGILGYAIVNSTTLQEAIAVACDYVLLVQSHTEVFIRPSQHHSDCFDLCYQVESGPLACHHDTHMSLVFFIRLIQELHDSSWKPILIGLNHAERSQAIADKTGVNVVTDQDYNFITIEKDVLHAQVTTSDPRLFDIMHTNLSEKIAQQAETLTFFQQLEEAIFRLLSDDECNIDKVAEQMCMSRRTLQRRLADYSVSFSQLLDNVRRHYACQLLNQTSVSMNEVALTLGYSELAAFLRAFKRWYGISPSEYREFILGERD